MRLLIVRHGEPDYAKDSLTEKGWKEAKLLANRLASLEKKTGTEFYFYMSPLGRAQHTASVTLDKMNARAEVKPWLREFDAPIFDPEQNRKKVCWDLLPGVWTKDDRYYDKDHWHETPLMKEANAGEEAKWVWSEFDKLLAEHGYVREGNYYRAERSNSDTIILFCHFGVECVMLAHLFGVSPIILLHALCAAPSSVSTLITEERREGIAYFRMSSFGDISHLYAGNELPSFAARFCETYANMEERHN